ncbi:MAG: BNR-4 repeat-containing protein [Acidobacteriota bacterium]
MNPQPGESYQSLSDDGAWCWYSDPRAVYYKGMHERTYAAWVTKTGDIVAGYYDHRTKETKKTVVESKFEIDDHDNPSVYITESGHIWLLYTRHATEFPILLRKSLHSENIDEWGVADTLVLNDTAFYKEFSNTYTYVNLCRLEEEMGRFYIFWRGIDFKPNIAYSDSTGNSWSKGRILVLPDRIYQQRRPYVKVYGNGRDKIHFAFTDGHPRREPTNSIYYMCYTNGFFQRTGEISLCKMERQPMDGLRDGEFGRLVSPNGQRGEEREPNYSGGMSLDHEKTNVVYLSRKVDGVFEIERWQTENDGKNWKVTPITSSSRKDNVRPFAIWGAGDKVPEQILWMNLNRYIH